MATPLIDTPKGVGGKINRNSSIADQAAQANLPDNPSLYGSSTTPPAPQSTTLTSSSLTPQPSFNLKQPDPSTQATGMLGYLDAYSQQTQAQAQQDKSNYNDSLNTYMKAALSADTEGGFLEQIKADTNVQGLKEEDTAISTAIRNEQYALSKRIEALRKNPHGMFGGALEDAINEAETESLSKQADMYIKQLAIHGKYEDALSFAKDAAKAMFERQEKRNEALKFNVEQNQDLFTASELRVANIMLADRNRELDMQRDMKLAEWEQKIKQSDPLYQANLAKTYAEIQKVRAESGGTDAKTLQKIQSQVGKAETVIGKVGQAMNQISGVFGGLGRTGLIGGFAKHIPGSNAYTLDKTLDTIKANLGFDALQQMRDNSPTGGALGQVAVQELNMLQAAVSALDTGLPADMLKSNLQDIRTHYANWLNTVGYELAPDDTVVQITN